MALTMQGFFVDTAVPRAWSLVMKASLPVAELVSVISILSAVFDAAIVRSPVRLVPPPPDALLARTSVVAAGVVQALTSIALFAESGFGNSATNTLLSPGASVGDADPVSGCVQSTATEAVSNVRAVAST